MDLGHAKDPRLHCDRLGQFNRCDAGGVRVVEPRFDGAISF